MYGERLNQFDFLVGKVLQFRGIHATANFNLYNMFNANPALTENNQYAVFRRPTGILQARLAKISLQFDF